MKKNVFVSVLFCCLSLMAQAQVAKYCMTYADFVADKWTPVDSLTEGRSQQAVQMKFADNEVKFKTGDKEADKILKKDVFAVDYGGHLYVNCRNLRNNDIPLDISGYTQAVRYDKNKLCVMTYKINDAAFLLGFGADVASFFVCKPVRLGLNAGSTALWICRDHLNSYVCYLIDSDTDSKGRTPVTRINDKFMEQLLTDDTAMLAKYNAISSKKQRQSASNVLPILMEKGLVASNAIN